MEPHNFVMLAYGVAFVLIVSFSAYVILRDRFVNRLLEKRSRGS
jgi:hypothetical protein